MNVSPDPVVLGDAVAATAIYLRDALDDVDVRADLATWTGAATVVHVHRVGGRRDRFRDTARIAIDVHAKTDDEAFGLANTIRALLQAWPARTPSVCRGSSEELGPTPLAVEAELPTVVMTWAVSI